MLAVDPGFRTGSKLAALDKNGRYLESGVIKPLEPFNKIEDAKKTVEYLINKYSLEYVAVGNGTGGKEMISFLKELKLDSPIVMVNEAGASIYSASEVARSEFPDLDITIRGAISIGRRLQDPLGELVKIDPKSIGVGQYQHDVNHKKLEESLSNCVKSCVNRVGVDVNMASLELLSNISGLNTGVAKNILKYRRDNGSIKSRKDILKVKGLGEKAFEQCAGFLRVSGSKEILDSTGIHPESYSFVYKIAEDNNLGDKDLIKNSSVLNSLGGKYGDIIGNETLKDIVSDLLEPGRDPREDFDLIEFDSNINSIEDLKIDIELTGVVTNVTDFGAFVDIGVHQDGLIHISNLSDRFLKSCSEVVKTGDRVEVRVLDVDIKRSRIGLKRL